MLFRFSLYGFLKNQQYYDLFIVLAFREKGLSFTMIGLLWGFREVCVNLMEVPTGAVADVLGRRRSMIVSFLAYIAAFAVFGLCESLWALFAAMFFFSIGEAFRTGTHKAMIFDWLSRQGRSDERTKVYGFTRSWSKMGSAVSAVIAAVLVFTTGKYSYVFLFCIIPYVGNIINFLTYPSYLDGERRAGPNLRHIFGTLWVTLRTALRRRPLRRLLAESMGFEGVFKVTKDYVQPLLKVAALSLPLLIAYTDLQRTAVLVGAVGLVLYVLSSVASRHAHWFVDKAGGEQAGARLLWALNLAVFAGVCVGISLGLPGVAVAAFVALSILQNFWRPILISRVADHAAASQTATLLSVESQAKSAFAAVFAPLLGLAVDYVPGFTTWLAPKMHVPVHRMPDLRFLPVGLLGVVIAAVMLATSRRAARRKAGAESPADNP